MANGSENSCGRGVRHVADPVCFARSDYQHNLLDWDIRERCRFLQRVAEPTIEVKAAP